MKYNFSKQKNDYKTPPVLIEMALNIIDRFEFDLDTCCSDTDFPAKNHYINGVTDGLTAKWSKYNWCNPPFDESKKWIKKAFEEQQNGNTTCMLLPVRTETKYWHDYILFNSKVKIKWLRKGYCFIDAASGKELNVFKNALALVLFENNACENVR